MKLFYCHIPDGNFGDELNTYLWPRLLPDAFGGTVQFRPKSTPYVELDDPAETLFVGIGTLIGDFVPATAVKHVFGSGYGYGKAPTMDGNWNIHCVRGPLTADALGLAPDKAIADPAILVRLLQSKPFAKVHSCSFIPHWEMALSGDWERVCGFLGINYIDPRWPPAKVIRHIAQTRTLITEALHGAIVADALRVPWIPVSSYHMILPFKWQDWCRSVGLDYRPTSVPAFWKPKPGTLGPIVNAAKDVQAALALSYLARWGRPQLSRDGVIDTLTDRLVGSLSSFCKARNLTLNTSPQP